ncbi:MAG TPA: EAL domain-containing protein [Tepiditoga sp.]|nr:EAL domain-containing protein [Tepiditoga sp.]
MKAKILIVDDSKTDRIIIEKMLSDCETLTASDGIEALNMLDENPDTDLIILDLNMPVMNGFEFLEILKSDKKYKKFRTIILTNYDETEKEIKGLKAGAIDYIRKPIHMESLRTRIEIHFKLLEIEKITERKLNETSLTLETLIEKAPIGIAISFLPDYSENKENITIINPELEKITGRSRENLISSGWRKILFDDDIKKNEELYNIFLSGITDKYTTELRIIKPDNSIVWTEMTVSALNMGKERKYNSIFLIKDITERKEQESKLKHFSETDALTGLYNRRYLGNILNSCEKNKKAALVLINFRKINYISLTYGYNFCEDIIRNTTKLLKTLTDEKCRLFQISFERIAFYYEDYESNEDLIELCEKSKEIISKNQILYNLGIGIGILETHKYNYDAENTIKNVSTAAERSKIYEYRFFDSVLESSVIRESLIKKSLIEISENKGNDFVYLQYQPIYNIKENRTEGFEALARLKSNKLGTVSPVEFISIAEETQLIIPIGEKIIRQACNFLKTLQKKNFNDIKVHVNISAIQLIQDNFTENLFKILEDCGINENNFGIEITESVFSENYTAVNKKLGILKDAGIKISIDDFGTGYSSLAMERELNVNCLKLDKYFIDKLSDSEDEKTITGNIISMAHKLGHKVIAEGVEKIFQKDYLIRNNCDMIQGYLFSKPLDEEDIFKFLSRKNFAFGGIYEI